MIHFKTEKRIVSGRSVKPSVIEPSFGLGRILYCLLEHAFYIRSPDINRNVLAIKPIIAPYKTSVLPLLSNDIMIDYIPRVISILTRHKISYKVDTSGVPIGRRYARTDEIGCPFGITIDHEALRSDAVTLRERDTTRQVRVPLQDLGDLLQDLVNEDVSWQQVLERYPLVELKED